MDLVSLRASVEQVDRAIAALPVPSSVLNGAWSQLVTLLAVGPAAATRDCPHCGNSGMRNATLCGYCWRKLVPPASPEGLTSSGS